MLLFAYKVREYVAIRHCRPKARGKVANEVEVYMKRTARIFVALALLFAGSAFAQVSTTDEDYIWPIAFKCKKVLSDVSCKIAQVESVNDLLSFSTGYIPVDAYMTWNEFQAGLKAEVGSATGTLELIFETDVNLGDGYSKDKKECWTAQSFLPLDFHTTFAEVLIDGGSHTIWNYCDIRTDKNASFFGEFLSDKVTIKDLGFKRAYVMAKSVLGQSQTAAVVAEKTYNIEVSNVKIVDSEVHSWNASAVIGRIACNSTSDCPEAKFSGVKVENVTLSLVPEVLEQNGNFSGGSYNGWVGRSSNAGGLAGTLEGHAEFVNDTVSKLTIPDDVSRLIPDYFGDRQVGGLVGFADANLNAGQNKYFFKNCVVDADITGERVGGLVGHVFASSVVEKSDFEVSNTKVTLKSDDYHGANDNRYLGGLVGTLRWGNGDISLSQNEVKVTFENEKSSSGGFGTYMGGLVGYLMGQYNNTGFLINTNIDDNSATTVINTNEDKLYAGGLVGQVYIVENNDCSINNNTIKAEIKTAGTIFYGGGISGLTVLQGGGTLSVQKNTVKPVNSDLIVASNKNMNFIEVGLGLGEATSKYLYDGVVNVSENRAQGNIKIAATSLTGTTASCAGGLLGTVHASETTVANNVTNGNLDVPTNGGLGEKFFLGYVVGYPVLYNTLTIRNNYHYGSTDVNADLAVGTIHTTSIDIPSTTWKKTVAMDSYDVRYNYRNAVKNDSKTLPVDGELALDGSGLIVSGSNKFYDGVISEDAMKSRLFTYVMNATQTSNTNPVKWESKQSSLPLISSERTAYKLAISLTDADYNALSADDKTALKDYLPAKCEARKCSLYVYTEKDKMLKSGLNSEFLNAGLMIVDDDGSAYAFSQKFSKDDKAKGLTDREIKVTYYLQNPEQVAAGSTSPIPVSMDDYVDDVTFAWPKVEKVRLLSSKDIVPTALLDYNNAKYELVLYQAYTCPAGAAFFAGCKNVFASGISLAQKQMNNIEAVLKEVRTHINNNNGDEIQLYYKLVELSEGISYMPQLDIGLFNSKAKINVTTYGYNKNDALDEIDLYELGNTQPLRSDVDMASKYGFNLAERGFKLDSLIVDFWLGLNETSTDVIKECYNEGSKTAKCAETNMYGDLSKNYFNSESDIENQLNAMVTSGKSRLMKWSTKLDADEMLNLDSMAQAMSIVVPQMAAKAPMFMAVEPHLTGIPYKVAFDINAGGKNVFLTDEFVIKDSYSRENDETAKLPEGLLATDACFVGWIENAENPALTPSIKMDGTLLEVANPKDAGAFDLYGAWDAGCTVEKAEVLLKVVDKTGAEGNFGTVMLSQSYRNPGKEKVILKHDFVDGKLEVPTSAEPMTLHVTSTQTNKDYDLAQLTLKAPNGNDMPISLTPGDTSFKLEPRVGESYTLYAMFAGYIDVSVNADRSGVMYGNASDVKTVRLVESGTTFLPKWVYTPTECVLGWSVKSGEVFGRDAISSDELIAKVGNDKELHAVWHGADACVASADYRRFKLESEYGTVEIVEENTDDGSKKTHAFAVDSTVLLPQDYAKSVWVVRGVPQDGYKLDSIVIDGRVKLVDGDTLADSITGYLPMKAFFSDGQKPVDPNPVQNPSVPDLPMHQVELSGARNGNAMHLPIEWKVDSGAVVEVRATLYDSLGNSLPNPLVLSVEGPGSYDWVVYSLLPGTYYAKVTINGRSVVEKSFVTESFEVEPEIAVAPNTWRMISLSDVDESAIVWDADPAFYYWDESAEYGVVWKYQKYNGGAVKAQQGVWYNSLEGRPLVLRRDVATGSDVMPGAHTIVWELEKGWNMVANPYGWKVKLPENVLSTFEMCKWSAESGFAPVTELEPYEAVWRRSDAKTPIGFAAEPWFDEPVNTGALQKTALAKAARGRWTLQAELRDTRGHGDFWNVLGVGAAEEWLEPPAGMGDFVNLSVVEGKKALLKSIKSAEDDRHEWKFALSATTDRVGYLKFEGVKALNEMGLKVYVTIDGKTTEMGAGDSLKVLLKAAGSTATVLVTSSAVTTVASKIENLRFTRVPGALQVGFDVSSDLAGAGYRVQLVSVNGKVAATYSAKSTAGHNTLALTAPKPGLYLLRVTLGRHHAVRKVAISR